MTLYIKDFIDGDTAISYDDGNKCLKEIFKSNYWRSDFAKGKRNYEVNQDC